MRGTYIILQVLIILSCQQRRIDEGAEGAAAPGSPLLLYKDLIIFIISFIIEKKQDVYWSTRHWKDRVSQGRGGALPHFRPCPLNNYIQ